MDFENRIAYLEGPGDIVAAFSAWQGGRRFQSETSVTFSSQFFDYAQSIGADTFCASYCRRADTAQSQGFLVSNMPRPTLGNWHVDRVLTLYYVIKLAFRFAKERRRTIYVAWGPEDLVYLGIFRLFGISVIAILHNALWAHGTLPSGLRSKWRSLKQRWALQAFVADVMVVSPIIADQVRSLAPKLEKRISVFKPKFYCDDFLISNSSSPKLDGIKNLLFVGRLEEDKGVFIALDALALLERQSPGRFHLTYCGAGSASSRLQARVFENGLVDAVTLKGRLDSSALIDSYRRSDIVLVPTTSAFAEGFGMVVAEAILCGKPVVCSSVVPSAQLCEEAVITTRPDDARAFADAIFALATDADLYRRKLDGCAALREPLLDARTSFGAMLHRVGV